MSDTKDVVQQGFFETGIGKAIARNWALLFLVLMTLIFSLTSPGFFDIVNFQNIIHLSTGAFLLAAAETLVVITGGIDLSVGYVYGLSSVLGARVMQLLSGTGMPVTEVVLLGCAASLLASLVPGFINGVVITRFKVPS
ncbi:MAG: hypothetical protein LLF89_00390, partial [Spirochaetaceae bacterium]|nr:hypothetical protein [Spirochaetaceae bacterium]